MSNDPYDNSKTDREMLDRLTGGTELPGDDTLSFTFPCLELPAMNHLTSLAHAAAGVLKVRGHNGPYSVTVTVACQDGDPGCEPQLWDDKPALPGVLSPGHRQLLKAYEDGPRIWDDPAILPHVHKLDELAELGLIESVPDRGGADQLTALGRAYLDNPR